MLKLAWWDIPYAQHQSGQGSGSPAGSLLWVRFKLRCARGQRRM